MSNNNNNSNNKLLEEAGPGSQSFQRHQRQTFDDNASQPSQLTHQNSTTSQNSSSHHAAMVSRSRVATHSKTPSEASSFSSSVMQQSRTMHQPHGAAAIGPSASNVTTSAWMAAQAHAASIESPLPPVVQRSLGDRSNEKRKNAALEIEALIKSLQEANNMGMIRSVIAVLSKDFCTSMNSNYRKGGLVGLAATAIGLLQNSRNFLNVLLPPVLHCFDDPESRVRYYACESLYNIAKVSRQSILTYFNQIFEGLAKLYADVDVDVKNGANLLDRLIKDIVTEAEAFRVEQFLPLLQNYIRRTNPYIRQLIVGWISLLDSIPDVSMLDYLPDFLDGLFNMLSDSNREIRQAADATLSEFLRELSQSSVLDFGPIVSILVIQCRSKERLIRLTAITWLAELIHHPHSGGDSLLVLNADILSATMWCISDGEKEIRIVAERTNDDFMSIVKGTEKDFDLKPLLDTLTNELLTKEDVPTKMAVLRWINMLMEKRKKDMNSFTPSLLPVLLRTLSDPSDTVVLSDLQVLSRISLSKQDESSTSEDTEEQQFQMVLNAILNLFAEDRELLETRGSLIIRKLCVLLNAQSVYIRMADTLSSYEMVNDQPANPETLQFISTMIQTLNIILLTATELHDLRTMLARSFVVTDDPALLQKCENGGQVFATLFHCWCHSPVSTFSLCLLAHAYDLSFSLVKRFANMDDVSVGFLMQIDKLVHLLESPIFVHLRLQLLDVESPHHAYLLKSIYGLLMCLPQGNAFRLLNERLTTVCNLRESLGVAERPIGALDGDTSIVGRRGLSLEKLLARYDEVVEQHGTVSPTVPLNVQTEVEIGTEVTATTTRSVSEAPTTPLSPQRTQISARLSSEQDTPLRIPV